jgi:hypothetical protein
MSRYGRKKCSACKQYGHNKRTCPYLPTEVKDARKRRLAEDREWLGKPKVGSNRKCSQCDQTGHNIKTCSEFKQLRNKANELRIRQVEALRKLLNKHGVTPGALIVRKHQLRAVNDFNLVSDEPVELVYIIKEISWFDGNLMTHNDSSIAILQLQKLGNAEVFGVFEGKKLAARVRTELRMNLNVLALTGITIEKYKQSPYSWTGGAQIQGNIEDIEQVLKDVNYGFQLETLAQDVIVTTGCKPLKKNDPGLEKELTSNLNYSNISIDGKTIRKNRIESAESFTAMLEESVK